MSDEVARHGGKAGYRAQAADAQASCARQASGRKPRLAADGALFGELARLLRLGWSPEQIAGRRKRMEADVEQQSGLQVSHEAIYAAVYALPRGELRRELIGCLRQDKPRRGRKPKATERRGKLCDITNIRERPKTLKAGWCPEIGKAT